MKKIPFTLAVLLGIWTGSNSLPTPSAVAQTSTTNGAFRFTPIPLTNQPPFTNTLMPPTNAVSLQLSNVVTLLLTLQSNIEESLPMLDFIQSNAVVVSVSPTNAIHGFAAPITSLPPSLGLTPTGAASGTQRVTSLSTHIGTNDFTIDAATLQAVFVLRNYLQRALPVLQSLNGTTEPPTNSPAQPPPFFNSAVTNFSPGPLTNNLSVPMTNLPTLNTSGIPSPF
jgi:hypothetical protein